jgi:hypothetical protein
MSLFDKFIAAFDPSTTRGRANIFKMAWMAGLFMLVLGYIIIMILLFL